MDDQLTYTEKKEKINKNFVNLPSKYCVLHIKMRLLSICDKELAPVWVCPTICHWNYATSIMLKYKLKKIYQSFYEFLPLLLFQRGHSIIIRLHLGGTGIHQNANIRKQGEGVISIRMLAYNLLVHKLLTIITIKQKQAA